MSVPGVSGGTMAIVLGIYDKLIHSISHFLSNLKQNILFLLKFCLGAALGIFSLSFVISWLLEKVPVPVSFFFLGAVMGGIPALYRIARPKAQTKRAFKDNLEFILYLLLGIGIVVGITYLPQGDLEMSGLSLGSIVMLLITGIIVALALVLPGISTSHMLLVLGIYEEMLAAIKGFDLAFIGILGIVTVLGIFLVTRPLEWLMETFPRQTYSVIIGFVLGSTKEIFADIILPAIPAQPQWWWWVLYGCISLVTFILGIRGILWLSRFDQE